LMIYSFAEGDLLNPPSPIYALPEPLEYSDLFQDVEVYLTDSYTSEEELSPRIQEVHFKNCEGNDL